VAFEPAALTPVKYKQRHS